MRETWKDIKGYEGMYQVSSLGRVRSLDRREKHIRYGKDYMAFRRGKIVCQNKIYGSEYLSVMLRKNKKSEYIAVHRLVASAFIQDLEKGDRTHHVHHKNGNKQDNRAVNLEVLSQEKHLELHNQKYPKIKKCVICGKEYEPYKCLRKTAKVCSKECEHKYRLELGKRYAKRIVQCDLDGNIIKTWDSMMSIQRELGINASSIVQHCKGRIKYPQKFIWRYEEDIK